MKPVQKTLKNGLRVVLVPMNDAQTVTVMTLIHAGCEHEKPEEYGIAHFLEHMCFKGTGKRPSSLILAQELESLGAETNAFTSRRYTGYHAKAHKRHVKRLIEVAADVYRDPLFPAPELEREKGVVIEEINMYEDMPQRKVDTYFDEVLYGAGTAEGHPILGSRESVASFTREQLFAFHRKHYRAHATTVVVAGTINTQEVARELEKRFGSVENGSRAKQHRPSAVKGPMVAQLSKDSDQSHIVLGVPAFGRAHKDVPTLGMLATILGGGFSSRLFQKLREELGVCYYVFASPNLYEHYGSFTIHAGVPKGRVGEVVRVLREELERLGRVTVSDEELGIARSMKEGALLNGLETSDDLAYFYGTQAVVGLPLQTPKEKNASAQAVTKKDIKRLANKMFQPAHYTLALIGPKQEKAALVRLLR